MLSKFTDKYISSAILTDRKEILEELAQGNLSRLFALLRTSNDLTKTLQLEDAVYLPFENRNIFLEPI